MVEHNGKKGKGRNNNLIPITERTPEERYEICRKGAEAVNAKRAKRKTFKEDLLLLMETEQGKILKGLCTKASKGDSQAVKLIAELIGENGTQRVEASLKTEEEARREAWDSLAGKNADKWIEEAEQDG